MTTKVRTFSPYTGGQEKKVLNRNENTKRQIIGWEHK